MKRLFFAEWRTARLDIAGSAEAVNYSAFCGVILRDGDSYPVAGCKLNISLSHLSA